MHVTDELQQAIISFHDSGLKPALQQMPNAPMAPVEVNREGREMLPHEGAMDEPCLSG